MRQAGYMLALGLGGLACLACATGGERPREAAASPAALVGPVWEWTGTATPADPVEVSEPERYTLQLQAGGTLQIRFDCTAGRGGYRLEGQLLSFGPLIATPTPCPEGSLNVRFMHELTRVESFRLEDGALLLELGERGGTMRLRRSAAAS